MRIVERWIGRREETFYARPSILEMWIALSVGASGIGKVGSLGRKWQEWQASRRRYYILQSGYRPEPIKVNHREKKAAVYSQLTRTVRISRLQSRITVFAIVFSYALNAQTGSPAGA